MKSADDQNAPDGRDTSGRTGPVLPYGTAPAARRAPRWLLAVLLCVCACGIAILTGTGILKVPSATVRRVLLIAPLIGCPLLMYLLLRIRGNSHRRGTRFALWLTAAASLLIGAGLGCLPLLRFALDSIGNRTVRLDEAATVREFDKVMMDYWGARLPPGTEGLRGLRSEDEPKALWFEVRVPREHVASLEKSAARIPAPPDGLKWALGRGVAVTSMSLSNPQAPSWWEPDALESPQVYYYSGSSSLESRSIIMVVSAKSGRVFLWVQ